MDPPLPLRPLDGTIRLVVRGLRLDTLGALDAGCRGGEEGESLVHPPSTPTPSPNPRPPWYNAPITPDKYRYWLSRSASLRAFHWFLLFRD